MAADANLVQCLKFCESFTGSGLLFTVNVKIGDFTFSLETMKEKRVGPSPKRSQRYHSEFITQNKTSQQRGLASANTEAYLS